MTTLLTTGNMFKTKPVHVPDDFLVDKFRRVRFLGKKEKYYLLQILGDKVLGFSERIFAYYILFNLIGISKFIISKFYRYILQTHTCAIVWHWKI